MDDIDLLLDTDILVDVLRRYLPALNWARGNPSLRIGIPVVARMELLQGARNQSEQELLIRQLGAYRLLHLETGDSERALQWFEQLHLRSGISLLDCLVAAIGLRVKRPLGTFNTKHFGDIAGLDLLVPYSRS